MLSLLLLIENDEDKARFIELYEGYRDFMYKIAFSFAKDKSSAEDIVHDSFVKIINNFETINTLSGQELVGYIVIIVKHTALDFLRKHRKIVEFEEKLTPNNREFDEGYTSITQVIHNMPKTYRQVLELRFVLEYSNQDIAKMMTLPISTVEQRISRGRKMLQENLRKEGIIDE